MEHKAKMELGDLISKDRMHPYESLYTLRIGETLPEYVQRLSVQLNSWVVVGWHPGDLKSQECGEWHISIACRHGLVFVVSPNPQFFGLAPTSHSGRAYRCTGPYQPALDCATEGVAAVKFRADPEEMIAGYIASGKFVNYTGGRNVLVYWNREEYEHESTKIEFPCSMFQQVI